MRRVLISLIACSLFWAVPLRAQTTIYPSRQTLPNLTILSAGVLTFGGGVTLTDASSTLTLAGGQFLFPAGTIALPGVAASADSSTGIRFATDIRFSVGGANKYVFAAASLDMSGVALYLDGTTALASESAGVFQQGVDAATAPAGTYKGADGVGTDKAGGDFTYAPGRPTGTGTPGVVYIATSTTGGVSNSTQQALVNRISVTENALNAVKAVSIGSLTSLTLNVGELGLNRMTAAASAPGAAGGKLALICGTNAGTLKLVAYAGTSSTGVTVVDNIGASVTGC